MTNAMNQTSFGSRYAQHILVERNWSRYVHREEAFSCNDSNSTCCSWTHYSAESNPQYPQLVVSKFADLHMRFGGLSILDLVVASAPFLFHKQLRIPELEHHVA
jgi:hypothetical protein